MPSYRYTREINPEDLQPDLERELTKKEKRRNWWQYHRYWVIGGLIALALVAFFVKDAVSNVKPDYTIGILTPHALPAGLTDQLQTQLAEHFDDRNNDGKTTVLVDVYTITPSTEESASDVPASSSLSPPDMQAGDPYSQMAGVVRLSAAFETGDPCIFLADPEFADMYQQQYSVYGNPDGTTSPEDVDALTVAWKDAPLLSGLDLHFEPFTDETFDGQLLLENYRIGTRALYGTKMEKKDEDMSLWREQRAVYEMLVG